MPLFFFLRRFRMSRSRTFRSLFFISCMLFFWSFFDGLVSFITPLLFVQNGLSKSSMGLVVGSSSVAGAIFDLILSKFLRNTHYRRMYLLMFIFSFLMPLLLWKSTAIWIYLIAMAVWGLYYDLLAFGNFDFVSRMASRDHRSDEFGILFIFKSLGYLIAPIVAGYIIVSHVTNASFVLMEIVLAIAVGFYILLITRGGKAHSSSLPENQPKIHVLRELWIWKKIGLRLLPVLGLTLFLNIIDAYFWTIGPLLAEQTFDRGGIGGFLLSAYSLPSLFVGLFVGPVVRKFRKKHTAFLSLLLGSLLLTTFFIADTVWFSILIVFFSSCFISLAWPAINGAYADYITEAPKFQREIEALEDFATNIGYIIGPITAGVLADVLGNSFAMSLLGVAGVLVACILFAVTPKEIRVAKNL